jgi:hypothetical protein
MALQTLGMPLAMADVLGGVSHLLRARAWFRLYLVVASCPSTL